MDTFQTLEIHDRIREQLYGVEDRSLPQISDEIETLLGRLLPPDEMRTYHTAEQRYPGDIEYEDLVREGKPPELPLPDLETGWPAAEFQFEFPSSPRTAAAPKGSSAQPPPQGTPTRVGSGPVPPLAISLNYPPPPISPPSLLRPTISISGRVGLADSEERKKAAENVYLRGQSTAEGQEPQLPAVFPEVRPTRWNPTRTGKTAMRFSPVGLSQVNRTAKQHEENEKLNVTNLRLDELYQKRPVFTRSSLSSPSKSLAPPPAPARSKGVSEFRPVFASEEMSPAAHCSTTGGSYSAVSPLFGIPSTPLLETVSPKKSSPRSSSATTRQDVSTRTMVTTNSLPRAQPSTTNNGGAPPPAGRTSEGADVDGRGRSPTGVAGGGYDELRTRARTGSHISVSSPSPARLLSNRIDDLLSSNTVTRTSPVHSKTSNSYGTAPADSGLAALTAQSGGGASSSKKATGSGTEGPPPEDIAAEQKPLDEVRLEFLQTMSGGGGGSSKPFSSGSFLSGKNRPRPGRNRLQEVQQLLEQDRPYDELRTAPFPRTDTTDKEVADLAALLADGVRKYTTAADRSLVHQLEKYL
ncbi:unnamed protein product [Amoebophrya sp. A120]|nr:unnamed protein product [Amoebophrya sp. A120]|eukprot:GSA120T00019027001.1